ncbi:MAG: oxidoreductase [Bacteroidales bacterium]|nr:oxidoreductase [Bacteroidales bacterium]
MAKWTEDNIPRLDNKNVIVTGANSGIGFQAAKKLALKGAKVIMACRNIEKATRAADRIVREDRGADLELMHLDLSSLASVSEFAEEYKGRYKKLDILINNAGVMATPLRKTDDCFEWQFGINHLGHFALTGHLLESITTAPGGRVVTLTSIAHFKGMIHFEDLSGASWYRRMEAYRQSKLANLLFAYELQKRLSLSGLHTISVAAHPGISATNIVWLPFPVNKFKNLVLMSASRGSLSVLMAATDKDIKGGEYIGPGGLWQFFGYPAVLKSSAQSHDEGLSEILWKVSEEMTGVKFLDY